MKKMGIYIGIIIVSICVIIFALSYDFSSSNLRINKLGQRIDTKIIEKEIENDLETKINDISGISDKMAEKIMEYIYLPEPQRWEMIDHLPGIGASRLEKIKKICESEQSVLSL